MKRSKIALFSIAISLLGGCASNGLNLQLTPDETNSIVLVDEPKVIYSLQSETEVNNIQFASFSNKVSESTFEMLDWSYDKDILRVERRTHNGISGSGVVYEVHRTVSPDSMEVIFEPKKVSRYQEGIVLPYPVPEFDINSFLSTSYYTHTFEINSEYRPDSVESNFRRLLDKIGNKKYNLDISGASASAIISVFPYRKGSKSVIKANIKTQPVMDNKINISDIYRSVENKISAVVNQ